MRICFLILALSLAGVRGADYYVSSTGSGDGTKGDPFSVSNLNNTFWTGLETGGPHTVYFCGGNYTNQIIQVRHGADARLYLKPGSAAPDPSGIDGKVLMVNTGTDTFTLGIGNGTGTSGAARCVTIDGETSSGAGTINWQFIIGNNHCVDYDGTGANFRSNTFRYLEFAQMTDDANDGGSESRKVLNGAGVTDGTVVEYCFFHDNNGHSEIQASALTADWGVVRVHHNIFSNVTINVLSGGHGTDFNDNTVDGDDSLLPYDIIHYYGGAGDFMRFFRCYNNSIRNDEQMIFLENHTGYGMTNIHIWNNVFGNETRGEGSPVMFEDNDDVTNDGIVVANNTFVSTGYGVRMYNANTTTWAGAIFRNNLFYDIVAGEIYWQNADGLQTVNTWTPDAAVVLDNNLIYRTNGAIEVRWQTGTAGQSQAYTSWSGDWPTHHPTMTNNAAGDPLFVSGGYTLSSNSPAIGAGYALNALFTTDIRGLTRGDTWDIGAYEFAEGEEVEPDPPAAVSGNATAVRVNVGRLIVR